MKGAIIAATLASAQAAHWAVLVAGSNSYGNYRHQADVCHAYQVVKSKGIPESNIITMAYDDIANNSRNPFPGKIFNKPTASGEEGVDVYAGCKLDYTGKDVTPANFEAVLTGTASGKKLESTADDEVFIFFSDHGAPGLIAFPSSSMHTKDLQSTFDTMHSKKLYKKLVMYLETCESGSMFQGMDTPGVYALSAANPTESSWGTYCGSDAMVNGQNIGSCLGDLFSVAWMEESDTTDLTAETLDQQFQKIKTRTSKSEVMQWGDLSFKSNMAAEFIGDLDSAVLSEKNTKTAISYSAREVDLRQAYDNYVSAKSSEERLAAGAELQSVLTDQLAVETAYEKFLEIVYPGDDAKKDAMRTGDAAPNQRDCEMNTRESFVNYGQFDSWTGFSMGFHKYVVNVCADVALTGANIDLVEAAKQACSGTTVV